MLLLRVAGVSSLCDPRGKANNCTQVREKLFCAEAESKDKVFQHLIHDSLWPLTGLTRSQKHQTFVQSLQRSVEINQYAIDDVFT